MRLIIFKLYDYLFLRSRIFKLIKLYSKTQFSSKNDLETYQLKLFLKLWKHATENVKYYSEISKKADINIHEIKTLNDVQNIPLLTKDIIRTNLDNIAATNFPASRFIKNSTSGSSGSNLYFYSDAEQAIISRALEYRKYKMIGANLFDRELIIWGSPFEVHKNNSKINTKLREWFYNRKLVSGYSLSDDGISKIYETMQKYKPVIIKSYPSILMTVCDYYNRNKLHYYPKLIHIGGEKLYDYQREEIERTFKCPVYDFYGARDISNIAMNCSEKNGLHVFMENVLVEVVDDKGIPIEEGEGELVITDLHNYVMPFIRYKIGDRARISKREKCKCGRNLQIIDEILGRTFEVIQFPNGNRVGGTFWTLVMRSFWGIKDFQVIQESDDRITINYTLLKDCDSIDFKSVINNIHKYASDKLILSFNQVTQIPVTKSGKMQFVISKNHTT